MYNLIVFSFIEIIYRFNIISITFQVFVNRINFFIATNDVKRSFDLTMKKSEAYLNEAKMSLDMLPHDFDYKPFLEFLFLTVGHYSQYWYNDLNRRDLYPLLHKNLSLPQKMQNMNLG